MQRCNKCNKKFRSSKSLELH